MIRHRIYLASSWRNPRQPAILSNLRSAGHEVYDFRNPKPGNTGFDWRDVDPLWRQWDARAYVRGLEHPVAREGLRLDFEAMKWASAFVMVQPCGRSAALELGWAIGAGKPTAVLLDDESEPELMLRLAHVLTPSLGEVLDWLASVPLTGGAA